MLSYRILGEGMHGVNGPLQFVNKWLRGIPPAVRLEQRRVVPKCPLATAVELAPHFAPVHVKVGNDCAAVVKFVTA